VAERTTDYTLATAIAEHQAGRLQQAESGYRAALAGNPDNAVALCHLGMLAAQVGRTEAAAKMIERAIAVQPNYAEAHNALGTLQVAAGQRAEAEASFRRAVAVDGQFFAALRNLGNILTQTGRHADALEYFARAGRIDPSSPDVAIGTSLALIALERLADAEELLVDFNARLPGNPIITTKIAQVLRLRGRPREALDWYRRSASLAPNNANVQHDLAINLLLAGEFAEGWQCYESRRVVRPDLKNRHYAEPLWTGGRVNGTLYIYCEQGFGDIVQFARLVRWAAAHAQNVMFEVPSRLRRLLNSLVRHERIVFVDRTPDRFDAHIGLLSLPLALGLNSAEAIARTGMPYLAAEDHRIAHWRQRLGPTTAKRIGIAWQGSADYAFDADRSIPLEHFGALARLPGIQLISLQKGYGSEQITHFDAPLLDLGPEIDLQEAFVDTAAIIASLDLVITSDTALAHVAGALGAPVWLALPLMVDWRWLSEGENSPWYPTMRLFRQTSRGDWAEVFGRMARALVV
jgi:tetratricopeptide (TPR) repeat protein